jgi:hypothetical protein
MAIYDNYIHHNAVIICPNGEDDKHRDQQRSSATVNPIGSENKPGRRVSIAVYGRICFKVKLQQGNATN